jgi:hypothetical protein
MYAIIGITGQVGGIAAPKSARQPRGGFDRFADAPLLLSSDIHRSAHEIALAELGFGLVAVISSS